MCWAIASTWCPERKERTCQEMNGVYWVIVVDYPNADYYYYKVAYMLLELGNSGEVSPSK